MFFEIIMLGYKLLKSNWTKFSCNPISGSLTYPPSLSSSAALSAKFEPPGLFGTISLSKYASLTKNHSAWLTRSHTA